MQEDFDKIQIQLASLEQKVDAVYKSSEKMRKYFLWTLIITVGAIAIPLLILPAVLPNFLTSQGVGGIPAGY
jgi:hypothetical protein